MQQFCGDASMPPRRMWGTEPWALGEVLRSGFPQQGVGGPLSGFLPLEFVSERDQGQQELVRPIAIVQVKNSRTPAVTSCFSA
jgi:hypothetical protein